MKFTMTNDGVPVGNYPVEFTGAEEFENEYGPGVRLKWKVTGGDQEGSEPTRIVSAKLSPKSNLFKFVSALKGSKPEAGEEIDLDSLTGIKGMAIVGETDSGATRVETFIRT